jgi:quinol monooxygenase YgiN
MAAPVPAILHGGRARAKAASGEGDEMITVMARLRAGSWDQFKGVHDSEDWQARLKGAGNVSHEVLTQLDDPSDVVFIDRWHYPQDADDFYFSDAFSQSVAEMGGQLMEVIKLESARDTHGESPTTQ